MKSLKRSKIRKVFFGILAAFIFAVTFSIQKMNTNNLETKADETAEVTLTFPDDNKDNNKNQAYTDTKIYKKGIQEWSIHGFNNANWSGWTFIRAGRKTKASTAHIATSNAINEAISKVSVTVDSVTASGVNSTSLIVASNSGFSSNVTTIPGPAIAAGIMVYEINNPQPNYFYKLAYDFNNKVSSNGYFQVSKIEYFAVPEPDVSTIEVVQEADKMDYYVGETFDKTGLEVKANYVGGTSGLVDNDNITVTPSVMALGVTSVELDYLGVKTTLSGITVETAPTVNSLSLSGTANKTTYYVGEAFDYDGLTVTAHLSNGKTENVTALATYTPTELAVSDTEVTITYGGKSIKYGPIVVKVQNLKEIMITSSGLDLTTTASERNHTLEEINFSSKVRDQQGAILFDKGAGYIYNTTSLNNITGIQLNYASGGNASAVQYFSFGSAAIVGHTTSDDMFLTSPKGGSATYKPTSGYGFFNISVSSANALQLSSLVVHYSLEQVDVEGITITKPTVTMHKNETTVLGVTFTPNDATNKNVSWESSDETKVSVTGSGGPEVTLTALAATGANPVTITATSEDGNYQATSLVTVSLKHVTSVTLNKEELTLVEGKTEQLIAEVLPLDASDKDLTWNSSDSDYVTVSSNGLVTAIKPTVSPVTVTATAVDNGLFASALVTVNEYIPQAGTYTVSSPAKVSSDYNQDPLISDLTITKSNVLQETMVLGDKLNFRIGAGPNFTDIMLGSPTASGKVSFTMPSGLYVTSVTLNDLKVTDGEITVNVNGNQTTTLSAANTGLTFNPYSNKITINTTKRLWIGSLTITTANVTEAAEDYASMFLNRTSEECGALHVLETTWDDLGNIFIGMDWEVIEKFIGVEGNPSSAASKVAQMVARYEFIAKKYGYYDFMDLGIVYNYLPSNLTTKEITSSVLIVITASLALFVGYYFISKKRKYN